ncbi:MAG: tRNA uridine-5-carboxymethylaminomethyl(34) synthesis GTPase MnmE [Bacteroidales bacterium]|nr:tRNA uridine-5-carboxymethylaminomethyl(34) synthesis GTPase MnmE [Bacteroidales bacterium]
MFDNSTIVAISTPPGIGAIAVIRMSGEDAVNICDTVFSSNSNKTLGLQSANTLHYGKIREGETVIDEVVVGIFKAPHSYTGENVVEISCHGSLYIQKKILEVLVQQGARLAHPGEFTLRAFLNGKLDLSQAEGVADLISSSSKAAHRVAINQMRGGISEEIKGLRGQLLNFISLIELELDFSEEDVEFANRSDLRILVSKIGRLLKILKDSFYLGNAIKNGIPVAIVGKTNSGKSTLLNLLLKEDKAIVSDIAGTTRDFIEDIISIDGIHFRFIDTAGIRHTTDKIEQLGIERTFQKISQAAIVLLLVDLDDEQQTIVQSVKSLKKQIEHSETHLVVIINKIDLYPVNEVDKIIRLLEPMVTNSNRVVTLSAKFGNNLEVLEKTLKELIHADQIEQSDILITNTRHFEALTKSYEAIQRVAAGLESNIPEDLLAQDIREVLHYLGEITGEITNDEILGNIFSKFCIGK